MDFDKIEKMTYIEINKLYNDTIINSTILDSISGNVYFVNCDNGLSGTFHDVFYYFAPIGACGYGTDCYSTPPENDKSICHICGIAQYGRACVIDKI